MTIKWADLGITKKKTVRDLWLHQDVDAKGLEYAVNVAAHGVVMLRVSQK